MKTFQLLKPLPIVRSESEHKYLNTETKQWLAYSTTEVCSELTEEAKENINEIHHRQPVIINQTDINRYLNLELQGSAFLKECTKPDLIFHEVSKDVNKPTNNTASLIQAV